MKTPVVLAIFNRPDTTARVMDAIRGAEPRDLFVIADGPRVDFSSDADKCAAALEIATHIDWECRLSTNVSAVNLGLRHRIQSGLNWVFDQVGEAIILEDDCLPHPTFFQFCEEMLDRFRDEPRVFTVSGSNFQFGKPHGTASYYFSRYPNVWGWATWRRAWDLYDGDMRDWPTLGDSVLSAALDDRHANNYWNYLFQKTYEGFDTWDYQLVFAAWRHNCLNVVPNVNLVSNLGFRSDATHPTDPRGRPHAELPLEAMTFPLRHPESISRAEAADDFTEKTMYSGNLTRLLHHLHSRITSHR